MFAIARTAGWVAHWLEQQDDPEVKIGRPRQIYTGCRTRDYVAIDSADRRSRSKQERPATRGVFVRHSLPRRRSPCGSGFAP